MPWKRIWEEPEIFYDCDRFALFYAHKENQADNRLLFSYALDDTEEADWIDIRDIFLEVMQGYPPEIRRFYNVDTRDGQRQFIQDYEHEVEDAIIQDCVSRMYGAAGPAYGARR